MSTNGDNTKSKRPAMTAFKQQQLRAWQPILTPLPVIITFLVVGTIFIPVGVVLLLASRSVQEYSVRYDDTTDCQSAIGSNSSSPLCSVNITITDTMKAPVYLYYRLDNFYQNHRRYVKSRSDKALQGNYITSTSDLDTCDPIANNGSSTDISSYYFPCGLIAASFFNDTITMSGQNGVGSPTTLDPTGIAWTSDLNKKFGPIDPRNANQSLLLPNLHPGFDQKNEDFIVWMRTAALPNFRKLYRRILQDVQPGTYTFTIENHFPVESFSGKKWIVLSTTSWIGGRNDFLGWAFIAVGIVCFVQGVAFAIKHKVSPRKLGDTKYLDWNK